MTAETPSSRKPRSYPSYETYGSQASYETPSAQPVRRSRGEGGFTESVKLEQVINANLAGLGL